MIGMEELLEVKNGLLEEKANLIDKVKFVEAELSVVDKFIAKEEEKVACETANESGAEQLEMPNSEYQGDEI